MFDLDHFKHINDNYGHDVGDQVLQCIAETTRKEMRQKDVLARFGGGRIPCAAVGNARTGCNVDRGNIFV